MRHSEITQAPAYIHAGVFLRIVAQENIMTRQRFFLFALCACSLLASAAAAGQAGFDNEEIKPYIKIINGPWVGNFVSGRAGAYTVHVQVPKNAAYALGLFDNKINRTGSDARSAVVLVDGVNPLAPSEKIAVGALDGADVSSFRKYPLDGVTFTARDTSGKDAFVKVVDAKEEWEVGAVKPFAVPAGRSGVLGRIDVFLFAAPAQPPIVGETVAYGSPYLRYVIFLDE
jgi:hypothetical protein